MYSIWLTFTDDNKDYLSDIIQTLSRTYQSPAFLPHITLYSGVKRVSQKEIDTLRNIESKLENIQVEMKSIRYSSNIWKTLYIQIVMNDTLNELQKEIEDYFRHLNIKQFDFNPHISLIYKTISEDNKRKIAEQLKVKTHYECNRLQIVKTGPNVHRWSIIK